MQRTYLQTGGLQAPLLAVRTSRKSVTDAELVEYASFSEKMKQQAEEELAAAGDAPVGSMKAFSFANNTKKK